MKLNHNLKYIWSIEKILNNYENKNSKLKMFKKKLSWEFGLFYCTKYYFMAQHSIKKRKTNWI